MGTDNNLVIYLDQPFNFTDLLPDISIDSTPGSYTPVALSLQSRRVLVQHNRPLVHPFLLHSRSPLLLQAQWFPWLWPQKVVHSLLLPQAHLLSLGYRGTDAWFSWFLSCRFSGASGNANTSQLVVMINVVAATPVDPVAQFVTNFYVKILGQSPSTTELNTWVTNLKNKTQTANDIATQFFINSQQGQGLSNTDFVRLLYEVLMQRTPGQDEIDYWVSQIPSY